MVGSRYDVVKLMAKLFPGRFSQPLALPSLPPAPTFGLDFEAAQRELARQVLAGGRDGEPASWGAHYWAHNGRIYPLPRTTLVWRYIAESRAGSRLFMVYDSERCQGWMEGTLVGREVIESHLREEMMAKLLGEISVGHRRRWNFELIHIGNARVPARIKTGQIWIDKDWLRDDDSLDEAEAVERLMSPGRPLTPISYSSNFMLASASVWGRLSDAVNIRVDQSADPVRRIPLPPVQEIDQMMVVIDEH